jgi:hypothetical protein
LPERRHHALRAQASQLAEATSRMTSEIDRARCMAAIQPLLR